MAEKLTMKILAGELEALRGQVRKLEVQLEQKLESTLEKAVSRLKKTRAWTRKTHTTATSIDAEERQRLIAEAAYIKAERRGFEGGDPGQDWKEAEAEIDRLLLQGWRKHQDTPGESASRPGVGSAGADATQ